MGRASLALALGLLAAAALPGRAQAHAGLTAPAATSDLATITHTPAGLDAKVVDGDQRLWLSVPPGTTVLVLGLQGEPYLRYSPAGIEVNTHSTTYYLNRARPLAPPSLGAAATPSWKTISHGRSTSWHEDRLHALALAAGSSRIGTLGTWSVPLVVDGRRTSIGGRLDHAAAPSLLWLWPLVLAAALAPALMRLRDARLEREAGWLLVGLALGASTAARLGRELYGRPTLSSGQLALATLTVAVAVSLAVLFARREWRVVAAGAIGVLAAYQGLALLATLRRPFVLAALPAWAERTATIVALSAGAALFWAVLSGGLSGPADERARIEVARSGGG
ncbi:MAG TPA: hypothetical protein VHD91_06815 [Gaiellaceae bacterium]|nr:hypothetical protein [Gaiellaceae bacterium]